MRWCLEGPRYVSAVLTESALVADGDLGMNLFRRGPGSISRFPTVYFGVAVCRFWRDDFTFTVPFMVLFTRAKGTRIATRVSEGLGDKGSVPKNTGLNHTDPYCRIGD